MLIFLIILFVAYLVLKSVTKSEEIAMLWLLGILLVLGIITNISTKAEEKRNRKKYTAAVENILRSAGIHSFSLSDVRELERLAANRCFSFFESKRIPIYFENIFDSCSQLGICALFENNFFTSIKCYSASSKANVSKIELLNFFMYRKPRQFKQYEEFLFTTDYDYSKLKITGLNEYIDYLEFLAECVKNAYGGLQRQLVRWSTAAVR